MTLYTYGYGGGGVPPLQQIAAACGLVVDIRMRAGSRGKPEFNKGDLARVLGDQYRHLPDLGNVNFNNGGPIVLRSPEQGCADLADLMAGGEVCILCCCEEWMKCHRELVAWLLEERLPGLVVVHLDAAEIERRWAM